MSGIELVVVLSAIVSLVAVVVPVVLVVLLVEPRAFVADVVVVVVAVAFVVVVVAALRVQVFPPEALHHDLVATDGLLELLEVKLRRGSTRPPYR
jgi:hypothetical protein